MHDKPRISLDFGNIRGVIVNAVGIEGERGISKQQPRICLKMQPEIADGFCGLASN